VALVPVVACWDLVRVLAYVQSGQACVAVIALCIAVVWITELKRRLKIRG
jgi:hypothetical protein